jgi:TPR repeat protein
MGVPKDEVEAERWLRIAAYDGHELSQKILAQAKKYV